MTTEQMWTTDTTYGTQSFDSDGCMSYVSPVKKEIDELRMLAKDNVEKKDSSFNVDMSKYNNSEIAEELSELNDFFKSKYNRDKKESGYTVNEDESKLDENQKESEPLGDLYKKDMEEYSNDRKSPRKNLEKMLSDANYYDGLDLSKEEAKSKVSYVDAKEYKKTIGLVENILSESKFRDWRYNPIKKCDKKKGFLGKIKNYFSKLDDKVNKGKKQDFALDEIERIDGVLDKLDTYLNQATTSYLFLDSSFYDSAKGEDSVLSKARPLVQEMDDKRALFYAVGDEINNSDMDNLSKDKMALVQRRINRDIADLNQELVSNRKQFKRHNIQKGISENNLDSLDLEIQKIRDSMNSLMDLRTTYENYLLDGVSWKK